jgi:hypothetical protein
VGLVRSLSLGTAPPSVRHAPQVDVEGPGRGVSVWEVFELYKASHHTSRYNSQTHRPVRPAIQAVESPTQLTESPAQAPILLSPITSRSSASHQLESLPAITRKRHPEILWKHGYTQPSEPSDHPIHHVPPSSRITLAFRWNTTANHYTSANAFSVGFRQTETLRQRQTARCSSDKDNILRGISQLVPPHSFVHEIG